MNQSSVALPLALFLVAGCAGTISIGAGITFVGNLILGFVANPLEELRRQGLGMRSWEMAVELQLAHADASAIEGHLAHCIADEAPTPHLVGEGRAYSSEDQGESMCVKSIVAARMSLGSKIASAHR
jgi:hypothetical protein